MKGSNADGQLRLGALALIAAAVALATSAFPPASFSFCNQDTPGSILQCTGNLGGHKPITRQGLGFLRQTVIDDILDEHVFMDTVFGLTGSRHFDGCDFQGGSQFIRDQYTDEVIVEFNPANPKPFDATDEFGQLLHTAQDFYSHSNWVELGRTYLIDTSLVNWAVLNPFQAIRSDVVVAQGESLPTGWSIVTTGKTPTVNDNAMPPNTYNALISGFFGLSDDCEDTLAIAHGSSSNAADPGLCQGARGGGPPAAGSESRCERPGRHRRHRAVGGEGEPAQRGGGAFEAGRSEGAGCLPESLRPPERCLPAGPGGFRSGPPGRWKGWRGGRASP